MIEIPEVSEGRNHNQPEVMTSADSEVEEGEIIDNENIDNENTSRAPREEVYYLRIGGYSIPICK